MRPLFRTRFQMAPEGERTLTDIGDEAFRAIREWIEEHGSAGRRPSPRIVREIVRDREWPYQIREQSLPTGDFHKTIFWTHRDISGDYWWTTFVDLICCDGELELQLVLGVEVEDLGNVPSGVTVGRPRILANLLGNPHWTCTAGPVSAPLFAKRFTVHDVEDLVHNRLFSEERSLPVVVFGAKREGKRSPISPATLASRLAGLAKVHYPRDSLAATTLNQFLGPDLAVEPGMVRVFMPGLSREDDPAIHWAFFFDTIERRGLTGQEFADILFTRLAERTVVAVGESPLLGRFRQKARELEEARWRELERRWREEGEAAEALLEEYERRVESLKGQVMRLEEELRSKDDELQSLRHQLQIAHRNIEELSRQLGRGAVELAEPAPEPARHRTVAEIVHHLAETLEHVEFLPSALESAEDVPESYEFPERVEAHLKALDEAARARNENGGRVPRGWKEYFKTRGLRYKGRVSDTSKNQWPDEYTFLYDGRKILFEEHFTISARDANKCLSIHFHTGLRNDRIVVAWVGRHLRNTLT